MRQVQPMTAARGGSGAQERNRHGNQENGRCKPITKLALAPFCSAAL